jgi:hypothetical protein
MPSIPPLVGKKEAAEILGVHPNNLKRDVPDLPASLQERDTRKVGHAVKATPLWTRAEVEKIQAARSRARQKAVQDALRASGRK